MHELWRQFCRDKRGNYALMTVVALVPLTGGLAMAVDYTEMNREKQTVLNALDAANFATARRLTEGATDDQLRAYALDFFNANLNDVDPASTTLNVTLPSNTSGGGLLTMTAQLAYKPYFYPAFAQLVGIDSALTEESLRRLLLLQNPFLLDFRSSRSRGRGIHALECNFFLHLLPRQSFRRRLDDALEIANAGQPRSAGSRPSAPVARAHRPSRR